MSLVTVIALLAVREARSLWSLRGVSKRETPRANVSDHKELSASVESVESDSLSYACAGARARARAHRETAVQTPETPRLNGRLCQNRSCSAESDNPSLRADSRDSAPARNAAVLKLCRCADCRHFFYAAGSPYCAKGIGGTAFIWGTREHVCDPPPEAWHYCRDYHGPLVSREVWAWPYRAKKRLAPGRGGPDCEPKLCRSAGGEPTRSDGVYRQPPGTQGNSSTGPSAGSAACDRDGNRRAAGFFRSTARAQGEGSRKCM